MQETVTGANHAIEARLGQSDRFQVAGLLGLGHHRDLAFDLRRDDDRGLAFRRRQVDDLSREGVPFVGRGLLDVADIERRLRRQEPERPEQALFLAADAGRARRAAFAKFAEPAFGKRKQIPQFLVAALGLFLHLRDAPLEALEIGQHQFGLDRRDVRQGIDAALDMGYVAVLEATHDVRDRVAFADMAEKLVAQPLALGRAAHQAGDVDEGEAGRNDFLRAGDCRQRRETGVRHRHVADIGLDRAEGIVGGLRGSRLRQRIEKRRLADIGQADDAAFETHEKKAVPSQGNSGAVCVVVRKKARRGAQLLPHSTIRPRLDYRLALKRPGVSGLAREGRR